MTLPQFRQSVDAALDAAKCAEQAGIDGVFVFDHLWPIGQPERPALHGMSLLAALAAETRSMVLGTLVARVAVVPDAVLVHQFATLQRMLGDRLIAGLGVGDHLSRDENLAYGVEFRPAEQRWAALTECCRGLRQLGITTWVGGLSGGTRAVARAEADALNLWGVGTSLVSEEAGHGDVTWGGQLDLSAVDAAAVLADLAQAGASWAVVAPLQVAWEDAVQTLATVRPTVG